MTETSPSNQLTEQALARLRKLADGNGLTPEQVQFTEADEKIYTLQGTLNLSVKVDIQQGRYEGPVRGKDRQIVGSTAELQIAVENRKGEFQKSGSWITACIKELKEHPGQGWGLEGAQITIADKTVVLAATENCSTCRGRKLIDCPQCSAQGNVLCVQCQGRRQEVCYVCGGTGQNPGDPRHSCPTCLGARFTPCRLCRGIGQMACPMCHGRRGTQCPNCRGTGQITQEVGITCGAETHFKLEATGLPSGLRRGLDRLGIVNLSKGHADIELLPPKKEEGEDKDAPPKPVVEYRAKLPYADLKVKFGASRIALMSAFGKKCALLNVPNFLDTSLEEAREKLKSGDLEETLKMRLIREALALELGGKGRVNELRKLYPVGLSQEVAHEILFNLHKALKQETVTLRGLIAGLCVLGSIALFAGLFMTSLHHDLTQLWPKRNVALFDLGVLSGTLLLSWLTLGVATSLLMRKRFSDLKIALHQKTGKIGLTMLGSIFLAFIVLMALIRPVWLLPN